MTSFSILGIHHIVPLPRTVGRRTDTLNPLVEMMMILQTPSAAKCVVSSIRHSGTSTGTGTCDDDDDPFFSSISSYKKGGLPKQIQYEVYTCNMYPTRVMVASFCWMAASIDTFTTAWLPARFPVISTDGVISGIRRRTPTIRSSKSPLFMSGLFGEQATLDRKRGALESSVVSLFLWNECLLCCLDLHLTAVKRKLPDVSPLFSTMLLGLGNLRRSIEIFFGSWSWCHTGCLLWHVSSLQGASHSRHLAQVQQKDTLGPMRFESSRRSQ